MDETDVERSMAVAQRWGTGEYLEVLGQRGSVASNPNLLNVNAAARLERMSNTATAHVRLLNLYHELDLRELLPSIDAPVLVLERPGLLPGLAGSGEDLAFRLPNATYVDIGPDFRFSDRDAGPQEVAKFITGGAAQEPTQRVLTTVLITDIVGSTERATRIGDGAWRYLLGEHDRIVEDMVAAAGGRVVNSTGDGVVAVVPGPTQALRCAERIGRALSRVDLAVRCGVHVGEVELRDDNIGGVAVHVTARVAALADAGEILATESVALAAVGSGVRFEQAGTYALKGLPDQWKLLRLCTKPT
jgi:class 3 adenylate cyclase